MDPDKIQLESMNKMFEYEKYSRLIDDLDVDELKNFAKSYFKLYLKQQEVIKNFAISGLA
jgi:hypothetical protein